MKLGACYPTTEVAGDPDTIRSFVRAIEMLGYTHMMAYDHVVKAPHADRDPPLTGAYDETHSFHDPFTLFSFAAAVSDTLELATGVLVLPQRQTALVAQQAADVDLLSRERFRMGVGIGWNYVEFNALGQDFKTRARRIEEQIVLLRELWTHPVVTFAGQFDRIDRAGINPRPRRQIPVWLGGYTEPAFVRGARLGDGFIFAAPSAGAVESWARVKHHLAAFGRSEDDFGRDLLTFFASVPQESADTLKIWRDAGGTHGTVPSMDKGLGGNIAAHIDYLAETKRIFDAG